MALEDSLDRQYAEQVLDGWGQQPQDFNKPGLADASPVPLPEDMSPPQGLPNEFGMRPPMEGYMPEMQGPQWYEPGPRGIDPYMPQVPWQQGYPSWNGVHDMGYRPWEHDPRMWGMQGIGPFGPMPNRGGGPLGPAGDVTLGGIGRQILNTSPNDVAHMMGKGARGIGKMFGGAAAGLGGGFSNALDAARNALGNIQLEKRQVGVNPDGSRAYDEEGQPITRTQKVF